MNDAARTYAQRVVLVQALVGLIAFLAVALLAPTLLVLERDIAADVLSRGAVIALFALAATAAMAYVRVRTHRYVLRALALGSSAVEPDDLRGLTGLPSALTMRFFITMSLSASVMMVPGMRSAGFDDARAVSLLTLVITILSAAAIPIYVLTRAATIRIIELGPIEPITTLLENEELRGLPRARVIRKLLVAVVVPVALVGVGAVLVVHAHLRTLVEESHKKTALLIARTALEPGPGAIAEAGRQDAIDAAADVGFIARFEPGNSPSQPTFTREPDGQIAVVAPVEDGRAIIRFTADLSAAVTTGGAAVGLLAVALAVVLGTLLGRALADDLSLATRRVRLLGTETVLRGPPELARPARFRVVADLGRAIEVLAERFRVFAKAQERAIEAREAAQRMRGLLFASVSHDLKSPLNAVLGFTELVGREQLSPPQRESLALIETRGRELLALIETILDAARVEAGQLTLLPRPTDVSVIVTEAIRKARELAIDVHGDVLISIDPGLPPIPVDPVHVTRSVAVLVAHALRVASGDASAKPVRVRATRPDAPGGAPGSKVRIDVEHGTRAVPADELDALLARQATARGRGLTLGLSLARSVIELHGGAVEVRPGPDGAPVAECWIPFALPTHRPRLSSKPAIGT